MVVYICGTYQCRNSQRDKVQEQHRFYCDLFDPFRFRYEHVKQKEQRGWKNEEKRCRSQRCAMVTPPRSLSSERANTSQRMAYGGIPIGAQTRCPADNERLLFGDARPWSCSSYRTANTRSLRTEIEKEEEKKKKKKN